MNCTTCKYLEIANYIRPGDGICHCFPERPTISYPATDWCGEWKPKEPSIDPVVIKLPARRNKKK
jgi:hypothetical protein